MNTGASQVFIEGVSQRFFGDFLIVQKVTRPAGRNILKQKRGFAAAAATYFAYSGKVGKTPPGAAFEEHFACGSVPRRLAPGPLFTREGHFGLLVTSGVLSFDRVSLYSRPTGAYQSKIYRQAALTHPASCIPTCWVRRWLDCRQQLPSHLGSARLGGVRTARILLNF